MDRDEKAREKARELARLVRELKADEVEVWWGHRMVRAKWHPEPAWDRMKELARLLDEA